MTYVLRLKGETKGWIFSEGTQETYDPVKGYYYVMDTGKMKYTDEWNTYEDVLAYKQEWDVNDHFDIVEYEIASKEYYEA
jgi:hypothetical protein